MPHVVMCNSYVAQLTFIICSSFQNCLLCIEDCLMKRTSIYMDQTLTKQVMAHYSREHSDPNFS